MRQALCTISTKSNLAEGHYNSLPFLLMCRHAAPRPFFSSHVTADHKVGPTLHTPTASTAETAGSRGGRIARTVYRRGVNLP